MVHQLERMQTKQTINGRQMYLSNNCILMFSISFKLHNVQLNVVYIQMQKNNHQIAS